MQLNKDQLIDMLYKSAVAVAVPEIGNRSDIEEALFDDPALESKIVEFFNEFGRAYAATLSQ